VGYQFNLTAWLKRPMPRGTELESAEDWTAASGRLQPNVRRMSCEM